MARYLTDEELATAALGKMWVCCEHLHIGSCTSYWLNCFLKSLIFSLKFYVPLNLFSICLRIKSLTQKPLETLKSAAKASLRSSMLLACMVLFARITICLYVKIAHRGDSNAILLASLATMPATFIESQAKVSELVLYIMPRFFDSFWKFLQRRNLVRSIPHFQVLLFCLSMSGVSYAAFADPKIIKPMYLTACHKFFGIN